MREARSRESPEQRAKRLAYLREWKAENPDYHREYQLAHPEIWRAGARRYRQRHPDRVAEQNRKWREENRETNLAAKRQWHAENRARQNAKRLEHHFAHRDQANEKRKMNNQKARIRLPWKALLKTAEERARRKGVPFDLTPEWATARWTGRCEITQLAFLIGGRESGPKFFSPSIDRIVPAKGYTQDNCRFVLWAVNAMKYDGTDSNMLDLAIAIVKHLAPQLLKSTSA